MKKFYLPILAISLLLNACQKDRDNISPLEISELNGYVQKGPFISGTNLLVSELNQHLGQTGKTFTATIKDDQGSFLMQNITLSSKYIDLRANGFYFNEVSGKLSTSQLSLSALADVTNAASVNVNLLTHLEKSRVEYLMRTEKKSFDSAKKQAQGDMLAIFNISKPDVANSEQLNITQPGEDNAILLAISAILQAKRTESELTELLSKISLDIEKDGNLDNKTLQSAILDEAYLLDQKSVRTNIIKRYSELGVSVSPANFEKHIDNFLQKTSFIFTKAIQYPATGSKGINILSNTDSVIIVPKSANYHWYNNPIVESQYNMSAIAPVGTSLRIKITHLTVKSNPYETFYCTNLGSWQSADQYDNPIELTLKGTGEKSEALFYARFGKGKMRIRIEIYENNTPQPIRVREITFVEDNSFIPQVGITYTTGSMYDTDPISHNILADTYANNYSNILPGTVSMVGLIPPSSKVKVRVTLNAKLEVAFTNGFWREISHQVDNEVDVYEFETATDNTPVNIKAHMNIKHIRDSRTISRWAKAKFEVFENDSSIPSRTTQLEWQ
jgi:hypothetical protein